LGLRGVSQRLFARENHGLSEAGVCRYPDNPPVDAVFWHEKKVNITMLKTLSLAAALFMAVPALLSTSAQAAENTAAKSPERVCLQVGRIWNWHAPDNRTLIVEDDTHHKFKLGLMGYCPSLPFKQTLGFRAIGGGSVLSCLTPGDSVFFHDVGMSMNCAIQSVSADTPEMEKADKEAAAAKKGN
jgi:hypothetical protein